MLFGTTRGDFTPPSACVCTLVARIVSVFNRQLLCTEPLPVPAAYQPNVSDEKLSSACISKVCSSYLLTYLLYTWVTFSRSCEKVASYTVQHFNYMISLCSGLSADLKRDELTTLYQAVTVERDRLGELVKVLEKRYVRLLPIPPCR